MMCVSTPRIPEAEIDEFMRTQKSEHDDSVRCRQIIGQLRYDLANALSSKGHLPAEGVRKEVEYVISLGRTRPPKDVKGHWIDEVTERILALFRAALSSGAGHLPVVRCETCRHNLSTGACGSPGGRGECDEYCNWEAGAGQRDVVGELRKWCAEQGKAYYAKATQRKDRDIAKTMLWAGVASAFADVVTRLDSLTDNQEGA